MNDAKRRYFSGDTLQQALVQAANYFNLDPSYVAYRSLEKKHGFLKTRRKVVIEVDPENPRRETPVSVPGGDPDSRRRRCRPRTGRGRQAALPQADVEGGSGNAASRGRAAAASAGGAGSPSAARAAWRPWRRSWGRGGPRERRGGDGGGERPRRRERDFAPRSPRLPEAEPFRQPAASPQAHPQVNAEGDLVTLPERPRGISERYPEATGPMGKPRPRRRSCWSASRGWISSRGSSRGRSGWRSTSSGEDVDWCFADDGEILMAIEHLLPRMIRSLSGGEATAVRVDCDNFHEIREERLRSLAQRVAEEVRKRGKPRVLEPMNPGRPPDHPHHPGGRPRRGHRERRGRLLQADHGPAGVAASSDILESRLSAGFSFWRCFT